MMTILNGMEKVHRAESPFQKPVTPSDLSRWSDSLMNDLLLPTYREVQLNTVADEYIPVLDNLVVWRQ